MTLKFDSTKLARTLAKREKLVPHLDKVFETFDENLTFEYNPKAVDDAWHPSGHCVPGPRALYDIAISHRTDAPPEAVSGTLRKSFLVGHYWHQLLQYIVLHKLEFCAPDAIERRGERGWGDMVQRWPGASVYDEHNLKWRPYHWATGSGDIAPCEIPGHGSFIVDFKTMRSGDFKQYGVPEWVADKYECQMNIYMDLFDQERALLVAINKDSPHDFKEFEYERNEPLIEAIYDKWEYVSACLDENEPPPDDSEDDDEEEDDFLLPMRGPVA